MLSYQVLHCFCTDDHQVPGTLGVPGILASTRYLGRKNLSESVTYVFGVNLEALPFYSALKDAPFFYAKALRLEP